MTRHPLFTQGLSLAVVHVPFSISGYVELERFLGGVDGSRLVRCHGELYREVSCLIRSEHHGCFLTGLAAFSRLVFPWRIVDVQIEGDTPNGRTIEYVPNVGASNGTACPACDRDATARSKAFLINRQAERAILLARVIWLLQHRAEQLGRERNITRSPVSTAPRCFWCGRPFNHLRAIKLLFATSLQVAMTCPEHEPIFASMPKEVTHAH